MVAHHNKLPLRVLRRGWRCGTLYLSRRLREVHHLPVRALQFAAACRGKQSCRV